MTVAVLSDEEADHLKRNTKRIRKVWIVRPRLEQGDNSQGKLDGSEANNVLEENGKRKLSFRDLVLGRKATEIHVEEYVDELL